MQEGIAGSVTYGKGKGRFALVQMADDDIPALMIIGSSGVSRLVSYHDGEIQFPGFDDGNTDLTYVGCNTIRILGDGVFADQIDNSLRGKGWRFYEKEPDKVFSFILRAEIFTKDGVYYCNEYDESKMLDWEIAYNYLMDYTNHQVSQAEYEQALAAYGLDEGADQGLARSDIHSITPAEIEQVFAKK